MLNLKIFCISAFCALISTSVAAQTADTWQTLYDTDGVELAYQAVNCQGTDFMACQVRNTTNRTVSLTFELRAVDSEGVYFPLADRQNLTLEPGQTLFGSCDDPIPGLFITMLPPTGYSVTVELKSHIVQ